MALHANPFHTEYPAQDDDVLIKSALAGNRKALNTLLDKHYLFIYNLSIKVLGDGEEAKDLSQDILIKVLTHLAKYDPDKGDFRAWLYRLAFRHLLDHKKSAKEKQIRSFSQFFDAIGEIPDDTSQETHDESSQSLSKEAQIKCMHGMLLCLTREQRLLYVLGDLFDIDHNLGAEIFEITPGSFRKRLSRIRKELYEWMHDRCGLVNQGNPCRCSKKTKGFIQKGIVNPKELVWEVAYKEKIENYVPHNLEKVQKSADTVYQALYREHPMKEPLRAEEVLAQVLGSKPIREVLDL